MPNSSTRTLAEAYSMRTRDLLCNDHPLVVGTDRVGIEIELENLTGVGRRNRLLHWNIIEDGSLRNHGKEFVTKGDGIGGDVLFNAATEVETFLNSHNPDPNWRCSTHVHLDVRDMNLEQLKRLLVAYIFFEKFLFRESGWERYKSNFCVPIGLAQGQIAILAESFPTTDIVRFIEAVSSNWGKYTALNLRTSNYLGTFEFRMPQPTYKALDLIKVSNRFLSLKVLAKSWEGSILDFLTHLTTLTPSEAFPKSVGRRSKFLEEDLSFGYGLVKDLLVLNQLREKSRQILGSDFL